MAEQLFQIGVKGLIRNKDGNILMVHIPAWRDIPSNWDFPGGRMDPGETFIETLKRELKEELCIDYEGEPKQLSTTLTNITIPVGDIRYPLVLVIYEVTLLDDVKIVLDPDSPEDEFKWFTPNEAVDNMVVKFSKDTCDLVRSLK